VTICNVGLLFNSPEKFREFILKFVSLPNLQRGHSISTMLGSYDLNSINLERLDPITMASCFNFTMDLVDYLLGKRDNILEHLLPASSSPRGIPGTVQVHSGTYDMI